MIRKPASGSSSSISRSPPIKNKSTAPNGSPSTTTATTTTARKLRRCMGRLLELVYTQLLVAIFVSVFFSIYKSSKLIFPAHGSHAAAAAAGVTTTTTGSAASTLPFSSQRSAEAQLREEALERLAKEAAQFEDDDNNDINGGGGGGGTRGGSSSSRSSTTVDANVNLPDREAEHESEPEASKDTTRAVSSSNIREAPEMVQEDYSGLLVQPGDFIYQKLPGEAAPIVLEESKLIFFAQAKVGCTVWKMLFRRMMGYPDWRLTGNGLPHTPERNGLRYLYHYNLTYASHIMTAPDWTRAIVVRDPKERFLSAYLDKGVEEHLFLDTCCNRKRQVYCDPTPPAMHEFMSAIKACKDSHWDPQSERMEAKYWPHINFIGHLQDVQQDAKALLQGLHVWEHYGLTGWGQSRKLPIFGSEDGVHHAKNAKSKVQEYLYPELELEVEDFYKADYDSPWLNLSDSRKFSGDTSGTAIDHATLDLPIVEPRDWIYRSVGNEGESSPIVIEKYKLVFFAIPHVAENEFKRLFRRMMDYSDWKTVTYDRKNPNAINKGLVYLRDYNLTQASEIMTSPSWTRAIFVRDPKERFALAYTQTAVRNRALLHEICCLTLPRQFCLKGTTTRALLDVPTSPEFFEGIQSCKSTHWDPITERLGALKRLGVNIAQKKAYDPKAHAHNKYWKYINFVGNVGNPEDAKSFLEKLNLWTEFGASGWADSLNEVMAGRDAFFTTTSFLKQELKAKKHVQQVIKDPQMESELEKFYEQDYLSPLFRLPKSVLYSSEGNSYGNAVNRLQPDVKKAQMESGNIVQRQW